VAIFKRSVTTQGLLYDTLGGLAVVAGLFNAAEWAVLSLPCRQ